MISHTLNGGEMLSEGKYLLLNDAQLRPLKTEDSLFEYSAEVKVEPRISQQADNEQEGKGGDPEVKGAETNTSRDVSSNV